MEFRELDTKKTKDKKMIYYCEFVEGNKVIKRKFNDFFDAVNFCIKLDNERCKINPEPSVINMFGDEVFVPRRIK